MCDVLKLHDEMLGLENNIHGKMEELAQYRSLLSCLNYEVVLKVVNGVLADIIHEAERYKEFIEEKEDEMLGLENNIHGKMEELAQYRSLLSCLNYEVVLKVVNGVLADIIHEAERYKEFIEEKEEK